MNRRCKGEGSLYYATRNGKKYWTGLVTIGYDKNGKQIRKSVSGYNKSKVVKKMNELAYKADLGLIAITSDTRLEEYYSYWLENVKKLEVSSRTYEKYETDLRLRLSKHEVSKLAITEIKSSDLQAYVSWLVEIGTSVRYTKNSLNYVKQVLDHAKRDGLVAINPCDNVKTPLHKKPKENYRPFTDKEQEKIIENLNLEKDLDFALYLDFATGLRRGELLALTWSDIEDQAIKVDKQVQRKYSYEEKKKKLVYIVGEPKTKNSYRTVPIPSQAYKKLMEFKSYKMTRALRLGIPFDKKGKIFDNGKGDYLYIGGPYKRLQSLCKDLDIEKRPLHSIRHSYATRLFEKGVNPKVVQKLMGHKDISTTLNIYTHVMGDGKKDAVEELNQILSV